MSILIKINSSNDVKQLDKNELPILCDEIREKIVSSVSKNGGHLASGLGAVELTVALHRVYDSSVDRIVFDVGHQCYPHKIITGRKAAFGTLRQYGGISGFPKPYESDDDAFIAGHASNSISVALGMARARTLSKQDYDVVAVIGDGALTGGLAYEGLCDAARSREPLVIILNDNNMSIADNVGGTARMLDEMRVRPAYIRFKRWYRSVFKAMPSLYSFNHRLKEWLKKWLLTSNLFSEMGFYYLGPIDGHDVDKLETIIRWAKELRIPVVVHVITKKGKGFALAENDPETYHGVSPFDPVTGKASAASLDFSNVFGDALCELAEKDDKIVAITAAMCGGTGLKGFKSLYPDRFFDVGIAEEHAVSMAAGLAKQGIVPVFAVYSSFLQRAYDQLIHDVSIQKLHVLFCIDRAGIVGHDGETHNGVFDIAYLQTVPGMTILMPASFAELREMLRYAIYELDGPVAIRYPRGGQGTYKAMNTERESVLSEGGDLTVVTYGIMTSQAILACEELKKFGIEAEIVKISSVGNNDFELTVKSISKTHNLLACEDVCASGCVGEMLLAAAARRGVELENYRLINLGNGIVQQGDVSQIMHEYGLDSDSIVKAAKNILGKTE